MRKILLTYGILLLSVLSWAQATGIPYSCSFEEKEDLSNWVLNYKTPSSVDQWCFGKSVHSDGQRSMYINIGNGGTPTYGNRPNIVVSYLRFKFPTETKQKNYTLSFDWKGMGDSAESRMYVMVCPEALALNTPTSDYYLDNIVSSTSGVLSPTLIPKVCQQLGESKERFVCGSEQWQNVSLSNEIKVASLYSQTPFIIAFIWVNNNMDQTVRRTGICIDNLQISSATIKKPFNMAVESICEDSVMQVSWDCSGVSTEFEIQYRKTGASTWRRADGLSDGVDGFSHSGTHYSYLLQRIGEGTYDVRVCNKYISTDTTYISSWTYKNGVLIYCPENHCVNYIDLHSPNVVCTYGHEWNHNGETPYTHIGVIDYGPDAEESRHTIHVDPTETDARTLGELRTVPPGALASVRLGNWDDKWEAESITYDILVDAENQGILIVQYAVVLEDPSHTGEPGFSMVVLDKDGNEIDEHCGKANFTYSDAVDAEWNLTKEDPPGFSQIAWKDWTTIGVNLQPYAGQHIKVRFTTWDCSAGGHSGYAYFTLDCASARLETDNCGNDSKIECYAPEGFAYAWYRGNPDDPGNKPFWFERELVTDPGRQEYTCRVSFMEDESCYFDVSTVSEPRFPVSDFTYDRLYGVLGDGSPDPCTSRLKFHNKSHVMTKYEGSEQHTSEPTNDCHWWFKRLSDGTTTESYNWSPIYLCPPEGDSIEVTLWTYIGMEESPCDTIKIDTIVVPDIMPKSTEFKINTCPETPVNFGGEWFNKDTVYVGMYPNFAGCDSISILRLNVWPEVPDTYRHDSICSDGYVVINGIKYNQPMEDQLIMLKTTHGCDSALIMTLTVNERIDASVDQVPFLCADDEQMYLTFNVTPGVYDSLVITFSTPELRDTVIYDPVTVVEIPYPDTITPGHYTATFEFHQFCCGVYKEQRDIELRYRASIVEQKWNDVLTVLAPAYNGGFQFKSFQWYKNGQPIPGEIQAYLYQDLDFNATYYVELTRPDGVTISSCPMQPVYHEQQSDYPSIVKAARHIPMYMEQPATIWYYTMSGQLYSTFTLPQGYTSLATPELPGVYVLKSVNAQGETQARVMIVE